MDVAVGNWLPDESVDAFFVLNDGEGRFDLDTVSVIEVPGIGESVTIDDFNLDTHADQSDPGLHAVFQRTPRLRGRARHGS